MSPHKLLCLFICYLSAYITYLIIKIYICLYMLSRILIKNNSFCHKLVFNY